MSKDREVHQQRLFDSTALPPEKNWNTALRHIALLILAVLVTEISAARADMVFDFQMKLARKGNAEAQFKVGEMYEAGRGVEQNRKEAMKWINKAAAQGNSAAGYKLLYNDLEKNGVNQENKTQLIELKNAAQEGDGYAQYFLGLMLSRGVGFKQNTEQALGWLGKASLLGVIAAEAERVRVKESRTDQEAKLKAEREARKQEQARIEEKQRNKLEAQRQQEKLRQERVAKRKKAEREKVIAQKREAERVASEAEQQKLAAQKQAQAEKQRQLVLQQRKKKKQQKKVKFESDPCASKSARFLSTCR
jgi:TPR repeat protein